MNRKSVTDKPSAGWLQSLVAVSIAGSLLLVPAAHAEDQAAAAQDAAPPASWNPYAAPGAVPPPPGPYSPGLAPRYRPDQQLEDASGAYAPPAIPPRFRDNARGGALTRDQFLAEQEANRKKLDEYRDQQLKEMDERRAAYDKEMEQRRAQMPARPAAAAAPPQWREDPCDEKRVERRQEMQKSMEAARAEQDKRYQAERAEADKRFEEMRAQQEQRMNARYPQAPAAPRSAETAAVESAPPVPAQAPAPAYGYRAPAGYGYGYPARPPAYGAPRWGYPGYPAAAPAPQAESGNQVK